VLVGWIALACQNRLDNAQTAHPANVISEITGLTGLRIIDFILAGQRDPEQLVKLRDQRVYKSTPQQMQAALVGD
jgi:transposase